MNRKSKINTAFLATVTVIALVFPRVAGGLWSRASTSGAGAEEIGAAAGGAWDPIPADPANVEDWYNKLINVPYAKRKAQLDPELATAQESAKVVKVRQDGGGDYRTITDAVKSIPLGNTARVIIWIGAGEYREKIKIDRAQPYVTLFGDPVENPVIVSGGTALQFGTLDSATVIAEGDYFMAINVIFANSAPKPRPELKGAQAVAMRLSGDKSVIYHCKFLGFQDTLCDDRGRHLFKDNHIQGTVDFIFGSGTSLYLKNELKSVGDKDDYTVITAHGREIDDSTGYVFAHCKCTGNGSSRTYLGRPWKARAKVLFAYTDMEAVISPLGWNVDADPGFARTVEFYEYKNRGPRADPAGRPKFVKQLGDAEAAPYLTLDFIEAMTWLLPPPVLNPNGSLTHT